MPVIKREFVPPKKEHLYLRLDPDALALLRQYCTFIESSQDHVIEHALRFMFGRDREFQDWLTAQGTTGETTGRPVEL